MHQWFHVVLGPCTSLCNTPPLCDSHGCELLLPLHAGYDMLLRSWHALHPDSGLCVEDEALDWPLDEQLPYLFPLRTARDECGGGAPPRLPYEYVGMGEWVEAGRHEMAKAALANATAGSLSLTS